MADVTFKTVSPVPTVQRLAHQPSTLELSGRMMEEAGRRSGDPDLAERGRRNQLRAQMLREQGPRHW